MLSFIVVCTCNAWTVLSSLTPVLDGQGVQAGLDTCVGLNRQMQSWSTERPSKGGKITKTDYASAIPAFDPNVVGGLAYVRNIFSRMKLLARLLEREPPRRGCTNIGWDS